jgi:hypothetical protein
MRSALGGRTASTSAEFPLSAGVYAQVRLRCRTMWALYVASQI